MEQLRLKEGRMSELNQNKKYKNFSQRYH